MEEIDFTHNPHGEHTEEDMEGGLLSKKLVSLVLGAIVLILVIAGGIYTFTRVNNTTKTAKKQITPTPTQQQLAKTVTQPQPQTSLNKPMANWKTYSNNSFAYTVNVPNEWEAFIRAGDETAQQIALHPINSADVPMTINAQTNDAGVTIDEFVTMQYGATYPRERKTLAGRDALFVRNDARGYISYFVASGTNIYEIATTVVKPEYQGVMDQILGSLRFTAGSTKGGL